MIISDFPMKRKSSTVRSIGLHTRANRPEILEAKEVATLSNAPAAPIYNRSLISAAVFVPTSETSLGAPASKLEVHHLASPDSEEFRALIDGFPENAVFRIINEHFVETALRTGTDKGDIESRDVRRLTGQGGYDVWGVEQNLAEQGLTKADVFCGTPKESFQREAYDSKSLGMPTDRSAVLVFDGSLLTPIEETDGYRFNDPNNKRSALVGVIHFHKQLKPFEQEMASAPTAARRVDILIREVRQGLQSRQDVEERGGLLSTLITNELYDARDGVDSERLISLANEFKERSFLIENWENLASQLERAAVVPEGELPQRKMRRLRQPAFIQKEAQAFLAAHPTMPSEFVGRFQKLLSDAAQLANLFSMAS